MNRLIFTPKTTVHCIGIGGIGVSAIARLAKTSGAAVSGSDIELTALTKELMEKGMVVYEGHTKGNVPLKTTCVVYSPAILPENPELQEAKKRNVPCFSYPEILGKLSKSMKTIAVSGTHGKSTTTTMIGKILEQAGLDPLVIVGTKVKDWDSNLRMGSGDYFVVEACEYRKHFHEITPYILVVNAIEPDHLDAFRTMQEIVDAFAHLAMKIPKKGYLIANNDDPYASSLQTKGKTMTFGFTPKANIWIKKRMIEKNEQLFDVHSNDIPLGVFRIPIPGRHNAQNALSAIATAQAVGVDIAAAQIALHAFSGTWRRFERVGTYKNAPVISDYGHHPTAIEATLHATREWYENKHIFLVFQPHQHNRTNALFDAFASALKHADSVLLLPIYDVIGRNEDKKIAKTSKNLFEIIREDKKIRSYYAEDFAEARRIIVKKFPKNAVLIFMGAGDIDELARCYAN